MSAAMSRVKHAETNLRRADAGVAVLATAGCAGTDRFQAQADVVRAYG